MCTTEADSMASLVNSLSQSFKQVPPTAIPAMLDCILASTALSPSSLFLSLLDDFPKFAKDFVKKDEKLDSDCCNYMASLVGALCHVLKKLGNNHKPLQLFLWKIFLPLIKDVHTYDREALNTIIDSFFDVVISTSTWKVLETDLVPFLLMSVGISMGMLESGESDAIKWGMNFMSKDSDDWATYLTMDEDNAKLLSSSFPIYLSCNILTMTLEAALQSLKASSNDLTLVNDCCYVEKFTAALLWDLFNMSQHMLLQSLEHRSCTIAFLLPSIFKALTSHCSLEVSIHGQTCILSRNNFLKKIWMCCKKLFSLGQLERRDAYGVLSLYLSFFTCTDICDTIGLGDGALEFDLRNEPEFWGEIKKGLVDEEGLVRKQSLHILKRVQCITEGSQCSSSISEKKNLSVSQGMTKRELWADKEAKSLGVGKVYNSDSGLDSQHQCEAFLLLYEMLEEYGTHLVEAAWNHQVTLLLQFSSSNFNSVSSTCNGSHQSQIQNSGQVFDWLLILWQRGFCHNNPLVRCMIMQSFLAIEWTKYGSCAKYVTESFVLGPFMEGLNDPVHHKDFGVKGLYSSETIKGAVKFLHEYSSSLQARNRVSFMIDLASVARTQSLGRAGLMALAECIASSARAAGRHDESEAQWSGNTLSNTSNIESSTVDIPCNNETELLDALRFVIESSKQHFNPNYRLQVSQKILKASVLVVHVRDVPVETLLHFISAIPREFTDYYGSLRPRVQKWLSACHSNKSCSGNEYHFWKRLFDFPKQFISPRHFAGTFDDEDLDAWDFEVKRWARVFFLLIEEEELVAFMLMIYFREVKATSMALRGVSYIEALTFEIETPTIIDFFFD